MKKRRRVRISPNPALRRSHGAIIIIPEIRYVGQYEKILSR
jgi:hypothetical protein